MTKILYRVPCDIIWVHEVDRGLIVGVHWTFFNLKKNYVNLTWVVCSGSSEKDNHREGLQSATQTVDDILGGLVLLFSPAARQDAALLKLHFSWYGKSRLFENTRNKVVLWHCADLKQEHPPKLAANLCWHVISIQIIWTSQFCKRCGPRIYCSYL